MAVVTDHMNQVFQGLNFFNPNVEDRIIADNVIGVLSRGFFSAVNVYRQHMPTPIPRLCRVVQLYSKKASFLEQIEAFISSFFSGTQPADIQRAAFGAFGSPEMQDQEALYASCVQNCGMRIFCELDGTNGIRFERV